MPADSLPRNNNMAGQGFLAQTKAGALEPSPCSWSLIQCAINGYALNCVRTHLPWVPKCSTASALEDLLQVGVVGGKAVVRRCRAAEKQAHGSPSYPNVGCTPMNTFPELLAVDQQVVAIGVEAACNTREQTSVRSHSRLVGPGSAIDP